MIRKNLNDWKFTIHAYPENLWNYVTSEQEDQRTLQKI